jgi:hypothetical protein
MQANRHRKTKAHRRKVRIKTDGYEKISCGFCEDSFDEENEYVGHMWKQHLEQTSQCGFCGLRFAFPQELSAHLRANGSLKCSSENSATLKSGKRILASIPCDFSFDETTRQQANKKGCNFTCDNITMLYYHKMLKHSEYYKNVSPNVSVKENNEYLLNKDEIGGSIKAKKQRVSCIVCNKDVAKSKLWQHLSIHGETTDVKTRKCDKCFKIFPTILHLQAHKRRTKHSSTSKMRKSNEGFNLCTKLNDIPNHSSLEYEKTRTLFKCSFSGCYYNTTKSSHLKTHQLVHDKDIHNRIVCMLCDTFTCKRKSELNRHVRSRHPQKFIKSDKGLTVNKQVAYSGFSCADCSYTTSSKQHYSRHLLVHTTRDKLIYKCKFCNFTCATVENLRKHILKTNNHPGLAIYSCLESHCSFSCNEANEYKNHLISQHGDIYSSLQKIRKYIKEYFLIETE